MCFFSPFPPPPTFPRDSFLFFSVVLLIREKYFVLLVFRGINADARRWRQVMIRFLNIFN